jgi:hypothetical protein
MTACSDLLKKCTNSSPTMTNYSSKDIKPLESIIRVLKGLYHAGK